ncbi:MAG TPA: penicillin-binding transpeptidase domain-containing protein [Candidatus Saccharimonadales bacterium]|nr:penicillin-binding transpeptidase domain-containing protein [Candidatus Saccharimonadales bacterium]
MKKKRKISLFTADAISKGEIKRKKSIFGNSDFDFSPRDFFENLKLERTNFLKLLPILIMVIFLGRLFQLTIVAGAKNRELSENNRIRLVNIEASRGRILDRNGKVLAYSEQKYFLNQQSKKVQISDAQRTELEKEGLAGENFDGGLGKITKEVVRIYPFGPVCAHVLGYTSLVQSADVLKNPSVTSSEFVGRMGVEETYEGVLRGVDGKEIIEVDSWGKTISVLSTVDPKPGQDVYLNIDADMQKHAYDAMTTALTKFKVKSGSLIITNPQNGEVLTLLSFPSFDPADIGKSVTSEDKPLFNRAIAGNYPPGSVFKIVTSFAGLDSGKITKDTEIEDVGKFDVGGVTFANWYYLTYGGRDGTIKIDKAIARSNDVFFFKVGQEIGLEQLRKWAILIGFGQKTGIDLPGESFGLVPDEKWKAANVGESWFLGDTMHMAIGQGFMVTTPTQVNVMTDFVANGGKKVVPHIVAKVLGPNGPINISPSGTVNNLDAQNLAVVRQGMREACQEGGTAFPFFAVTRYTISCKTGTAEKLQGDPHAWFSAYAPSDFPQLSITVMIENGGEGSVVAAPVAKEVLDWYFSQGQNSNVKTQN